MAAGAGHLLFDLVKLTARNLTNNPANDAHPMFFGKTLYFLSDRDRTALQHLGDGLASNTAR
jgi:hypothetical protein